MKWGNNSIGFQFLDIILHSITLDNILLKNPLKNGCLLGILLNDTERKRFRLKPGFKVVIELHPQINSCFQYHLVLFRKITQWSNCLKAAYLVEVR